MEDIQGTLKNLFMATLETEGFELVDLVVKGNKSSRVLQFFIDRENGVTVNDCVYINRKLSDVLELESEHLKLHSYRLEVSSPGVNRRMTTEKDFRRNIGKTVTISYLSDDSNKVVEGKILTTDDDSVLLQTGKNTLSLDFSSIQKAKIKLKW